MLCLTMFGMELAIFNSYTFSIAVFIAIVPPIFWWKVWWSAFISYNINLETTYLFFVIIPNIVKHRVHVCSWPLLAPAAKQVTVHWPQPWVAWPMGRWRSSQAGQITLHFYIPSQVYISSLHLKIPVSWSLFKLKLHSINKDIKLL